MTIKHIPLLLSGLLVSCTIETRTGPSRSDTFAVDRDKSEFLRVDLNMKAGELRLSGGASKFLEGSATYNVDSWKPIVRYSSVAGRGNLRIEQPPSATMGGNTKNVWDVRLPDDVPLDLTVECGAGEANLNAGSLALRSVEVRLGAGRLEMDLRGGSARDYDVRVRGGVGEAVIRLPKHAGIYARASGGLGSINVSGLRQEGDHWVSDVYDRAGPAIRVDVHGGIGEIKLISE
jgi:hypothetical protein